MNEYDSDRMQDLLNESHGFETTLNEEEADLILLNTCSIREKAQEKVFHQLGRWKKLKEKNPNLKIGVGGCVASQEGENIIKRAPQVDMVLVHKLSIESLTFMKRVLRTQLILSIYPFPKRKSLNISPIKRMKAQLHLCR